MMSDYDVGYGKPPKHTQFKKGQPRPPRKKRQRANLPRDMRIDILTFLDEDIPTSTSKGLRKMKPFEISLRSLFQLANRGNMKAMVMWFKLTEGALSDRLQSVPGASLLERFLDEKDRNNLALQEFVDPSFDLEARMKKIY